MADINFPLDHPLYGPSPGIHATPSQHLSNMGLEIALPDGTFAPITMPADSRVWQAYNGMPGVRKHPGPVTVRSNSGNPEYDADALFAAKRAIQHGGLLPGLPAKPLPGPEGAPMLHKIVNVYREGLTNGKGVVNLPPQMGGPQPVFDPNDTLEPGEEGYAPQMAPEQAMEQRQPMSAKSAWYEEREGWVETSGWHEVAFDPTLMAAGSVLALQVTTLMTALRDRRMSHEKAIKRVTDQLTQEGNDPQAIQQAIAQYEETQGGIGRKIVPQLGLDVNDAVRQQIQPQQGQQPMSAWRETNDVEAQKPQGNIEYNDSPHLEQWYEDDPHMDMAEHHASEHTALGERQLDGGVGGQPTDQWNPQVNGPNADMAPSADNANNSHEQEVALQMWVNFAVQELSRGEDPMVIAPKMEQAGCPPHLVQQAIQLAQQKQEDPVSNDAGQDAFAGQPTVPAQTTPGEQGGVSMPGQTMSSIHREIVERTEGIEERKGQKVIATGLWGEELEQADPLSSPLSPVDELQSFIDSFEPLDESREASVKARIANLKMLRQSVRQVDVGKLSATDQILIDNLDVDAQLGLLNLSSHLTEFQVSGHLMDDGTPRPTYQYDGYRTGGEFAQPMDESEEAAEILISEMPAQLRHDDQAVTAIAMNAGVLPRNALKAASRYAVEESVESAHDEDEIDDGPAEALFTT